MRASRPQSLEFLLDDASEKSPLHQVQQHAIVLLKINRAVKALLPSPLRPWCRVANYRQGILVLETANASWMMRLRYEQPTLLSALRGQILPSLSAINIRINPTLMAKSEQLLQSTAETRKKGESPPPLRQLSIESALQLRELATRSPDKLRKILERLAALAEESINTAN